MQSLSQRSHRLFIDLFWVSTATFFAVWLGYTHAFDALLDFAPEMRLFGIFIVGTLFTSVFTVPFAIVGLGQLALSNPLWQVVIFGGIGAALGDYILFKFVKDRIAADVGFMLRRSTRYQAFMHLLAYKKFRYIAFGIAMALIASPLPDETALTVLGVTRAKDADVIKLVFTANCIGILLIGMGARAIVP